ncbi:MAG: AAA family ATPase [Chitinophagaceae bacterium]
MTQMINQLRISNYKSINEIDLDCSRINVLVGEPNAGKSNILEALNLSYLSWLFYSNNIAEKAGFEKVNIKDFFRADKVDKLFHLGDTAKPISIIKNGLPLDTFLRFNQENDKNIFEWSNSNGTITEFNNDFVPKENTQNYASPIKPYMFKDNIQPHDSGNYIHNLMPPFGNNLYNVILRNKSFQETIKDFTEDYGFELNIDTSTNELLIQIRINEGLVYSIPYKSLADTFKRLLFYIAAIRYNNANVITLDEPDAHAFPKYVSYLGDEIIKAENNQFFIATHNPYLLNNLIENTPLKELSVFVCGYDKNLSETIVKKLSTEDLSELLDYGVDIFFNINKYLDDRIEHIS